MNFEKKLKDRSPAEIWQEYCGFLDLSIDDFMQIQYRLLQEQIDLLKASIKCLMAQHKIE